MSKRKIKEFTEYRVSARVVLHKGTIFNATGGPYFESTEGGRTVKVSMADKGPFIFQKYCEQGADKWIEALQHATGTCCVLYVGRKRRSDMVHRMVRRPYKIKGVTSAAAVKAKLKRATERRVRA